MNFLNVLQRRELQSTFQNESLFQDYSLKSQLDRLRCLKCDEFSCLACHESGTLHYEIPPFVSKFTSVLDQEHVLAVADEEGIISLVDTSLSGTNVIIRFHAHHNAIFDLCWMDNEKKLVTVSGDRTSILWDVPKQTEIAIFKGHTRSVKTVHFRPNDKAVFATGGRDGNIFIWDTRSQKRGISNQADNILRNVHMVPSGTNGLTLAQKKQKISKDTLHSTTVVLFQDEFTLLSAGSADGVIKVWDLRKNYGIYRNNPIPKHIFPYAGLSKKHHGYSSLLLDSSGSRLFASCTDHIIYQFNSASYEPEPVSTYYGHETFSFFVKSTLSPNNEYILSGSSDKNAYIWKVDCPGRPVYSLSGHLAEVTCVDWCRDNYDTVKLVTGSDDLKFRIWRVSYEDNKELLAGVCEKVTSGKNDPWMSKFARNGHRKHESILNSAEVCNMNYMSPGESQSPSLPFKSDLELCVACTDGKVENEEYTMTPVSRLPVSPRKSSRLRGAKRSLNGRCLFSNIENKSPENKLTKAVEIHEVSSPKPQDQDNLLVLSERSPLLNITQTESVNGQFQPFSPTLNLPNSVVDKQFSTNLLTKMSPSPKCDNWLAKLCNAKSMPKTTNTPKPKKTAEKSRTDTSSGNITKYFSAMPKT